MHLAVLDKTLNCSAMAGQALSSLQLRQLPGQGQPYGGISGVTQGLGVRAQRGGLGGEDTIQVRFRRKRR